MLSRLVRKARSLALNNISKLRKSVTQFTVARARSFTTSSCDYNNPQTARSLALNNIKRHSVTQFTVAGARSFTTSSCDYNNPQTQLLEENEKLNCKVYYQHGLPTAKDIAEYNAFNNQIWYGRSGQETVYKMINMGDFDTKHCDLFIVRDYHNHKIVGVNALKRVSSHLGTLLHSNSKDDDKPFNFTIRRNTAILQEMQGKGYGKIVRKYSKELDELHTGDCGLSITDVQVENTPSINLQLRSGFEIIDKTDMMMYYRINHIISDEVLSLYDMVHIDGSHPLFMECNNLHKEYNVKHGLIDLSVTPNAIESSLPLYIVKSKADSEVLAIFQVMPLTLQMKAATRREHMLHNVVLNKFLTGYDGMEKDFKTAALYPMYIDYENEKHDIVHAVQSLVTYILKQNKIHFGSGVADVRNPYAKFFRENQTAICGRTSFMGQNVGTALSVKDQMYIIMKFIGLNEMQLRMMKNHPICVKLPITLF